MEDGPFEACLIRVRIAVNIPMMVAARPKEMAMTSPVETNGTVSTKYFGKAVVPSTG